MQIGQAKFGMQTLNQSLCMLFLRKAITLEDALGRSSDADELKTMIAQAQTGGPGPGGQGAPPRPPIARQGG
jgi:twitching motility protein PilT